MALDGPTMRTYFAIVHEDKDSAVGVVFPDLPGCFSAGDTFDEAIANAGRALRLYAAAERAAGRTLPEPRSFAQLYRDRGIRQEARGAPFVGIRLEDRERRKPSIPRKVSPRRRQGSARS